MKKFLQLSLSLLLVCFSINVKAQYDLCTGATSHLVTLPYSVAGQTTCGKADDFDGTVSCSSPSSVYSTGPDVFYAFTAATTGQIIVQYTTTATYEYPAIFIFQGCPSSSTNATNCVGGASASTGNISATFNATAGQTYVVMIDNWVTPACLSTYGLYIGAAPTATLQPPCTNLGFESGLTGWFPTSGVTVDGITTAPTPVYNVTAYNNTSQVSIVTAGTDTYGGFSKVFSGSQSCMIGDGNLTGALGGSIEQYFQVTAANANFTYNYACVLEDGGHPNYEQPFFQVDVFDQTGNPISCGNYIVTAPGTGWTLSGVAVSGVNDVYYKGWTTVSVNLLSYIGQNVRVRFTAGDCSPTAHFGYAYVDCSCAPWSIPTQTICVGSSATLSAPAGALTYSWVPGGSTAQNITVSPGTTTAYTCNLTSQGTTPCSGQLTTTVTVLPTPTTAVTSATICKGSSTVLTASGATTYSWSPGTGLSATNTATVTANPTVTTTYTITGTNATCSSVATSTVTVTPIPTVTVNSPTICNGTSTVLTASGATTYSWSPGTGLSATTGANPTANPTVTTTYTITGTTATCTSTATSTVTVSPIPTVTVNSPTICKGSSTVMTASGATTYSWSPATGLSATTGANPTANPTVTTTYTVVGTTGTCTSSATAVVTVNPLPTVTVNSPAICNGGSTVLTASGATTYSWSPATGLSATTGANPTANPTVTTTYTIVGTTATCTSSITSTVTVNPTPTVTVNSPTICNGSSTVLTASGATTYSWSPATGLSATTGANPTANPTTTTTYTIVGTTGTCTSSATAVVTVNPLPTVTVNSPTICKGNSTVLTASGATTYSWSPATGLSATTGANPTANPTVTTTYTIVGTTATCTSSATSVVTVNPLPTVTVASATICPGASTTMSAAGASTYTWAPAGSLSSSTGTTVTATPASTTVYTITGTAATTCTATATATITIGAGITPTVPSATICNGSSTTLNASGGTTYTWSPATGLSATTGASVTANPTSTTTYTINAASGACTGTTTAVVTVNPLPTVTVNSPSICVGASTTLNAGGATTYSWSPATGLSATTGASVTANPTVTTTYTIVGTTATCTAQATSIVTVNPLPTITVNNATYCTGGSATLTAGGASTYTWSPATGLSATTGASVTANPATSTNYTVTGTSAAGCVNTATTSITVVTNPTVTPSNATICIGGSVVLTANGATTYAWSPGTGLSSTSGSTVTASPASTTVYTITGTAGTCTATATATVNVNPLPTITVNTSTICLGQQTATLTAGGASTYTWSPATGLSSSNGSPVTATPGATTSYTVTGTDANGCVNTNTTTVTVNPLPTVTVNSASVCPGAGATLTAAGAATYSWNTGATTASITQTPATTTSYTVTGTSAAGCVSTATASITVLTGLTITPPSSTICVGNSTTLTASGATTYTWSPGTGLSSTNGASVTANPTVSTTYTITGSSGTCSAVATATLIVNPLPTVTVNSGTICVGQQTATLTAAGASTYSWNPATGLSSSSGASVVANPASTTSYTVTGTDVNGCVNTATTTIVANPQPTLTVNSGFICNGSSATLNVSGANTYTWSPATGLSATTGASVNASPAASTQYTITGTDANGCTNTDTTSVIVVSNPTVTPTSATICIGSSVVLTATGAATYVWSPGTGLSSTTGSTVTASPASTTIYTVTGTAGTCTAVATATVTVNPLPVVTATSQTICVGQQTATLTAGGASTYSWSPGTGLSSTTGATVTGTPTASTSYTVTGTDVNGCVSTATTAITVNPLPTITLNSGFICNGSTATLNAGGASTYSWSPGTGLSATTGSSVNANPATTTNYTITGTDANGCVSSDTTSVIVVSNPTVTPTSVTICIGDSAALTASGAASYVWTPGTGLSSSTGSSVMASPAATTVYTVTGTAGTCTAVATATVTVNPLPVVGVNSGTICLGQQTATLTATGASTYSWNPSTGLSSSSGTSVTATPNLTTSYTVTGTDGNGCVNTATTTVTVNSLPVVTLTPGLICVGGSTTLTAGGAATYSWIPGTGLSATTGASVTANPPTTTLYTVVGVDANGCINGDTATLTVVTNPVINVPSATICIGDSAALNATGATTYTWSPATGLSATNGASVNASPSATTVYTIDGTVGTCTATTTATVVVNALPTVVVNSGTICLGQQTATLTAGGASTYSWSPGTGLSSTTGASVTATPVITTPYTVTGTDVNGCVNTATTSVTVNPLPVVTATGTLICVGGSTTLNAAGAVTYSWIPSTGLSATNIANPVATPASTTQYTVVGIDANGCINGDTATVQVVTNPVISVASSTICIGNSANLSAIGASTYTWSPAAGLSSTSGANVTANPTVTSVYTIDGTVGTCTATTTATVVVNPLPVLTIGSNSPVCVNQTLNLNSSGGPGYLWNGPNSFSSTLQNPSIPGVTAVAGGTYTLTVVDANTCVNTATVSVVVNPLPVVTVGGSTVCLNQTISLSANGGIGYSWSGPMGFASNMQNPTIPNANAGMAGTYVVTVTDGNNCVNANVAQVVLNSIPVVSVTSGTVCMGTTTPLVASGASTYVWSPATGLSSTTSTTVNAGPNATTTYTVIGTDANGCIDTTTTIVNVNPAPAVSLTPSAVTGCAPVCVTFSNTAGTTGTCFWKFGDGTTSTNCAPNHCFTVAGTYSSIYTLTDANGCTNKDTATVTVYPVPVADFSFDPQPTTILDPTIHFQNQTTGGAVISTYGWTFGDNSGMTATIPAPTHTYMEAGSYPVQLIVISNHGCRDSITKTVVIGEDYFIYVPNAFSPNSDGTNETFFAKGEGIKDFKMYIFDRWGNEIFFSDDIYKGWDGRFMGKGETIVQEDVYVWKIVLHTFRNEQKMLKGTVSLIK